MLEEYPVSLLWTFRVLVGILNLICAFEFLLYFFFVVVCFYHTLKMMKTVKERSIILFVFFVFFFLQISNLPIFVMYFPTALFGISPTEKYLEKSGGDRYPYTAAVFLPQWVVQAALFWIFISFLSFQILPLIGVVFILAKYGVNPKRESVNQTAEQMDQKKLKVEEYFGHDDKIHYLLSDASLAPTVLIVMPIYNEEPEALFNAVVSVTRSNYLKSCMHLFLSFDDEKVSELYLRLLDMMGVFSPTTTEENSAVMKNFESLKTTLPSGTVAYDIPSQLTVTFEGVCVTICRFPHNGKRATQAKTFKMINKMYGRSGADTERTFVLYIDSDVILHENAIYEFSRSLELYSEKVAYTGYITCRTSLAPWNPLVAYQDSEYMNSQLYYRSFEATLGGVVCLPGALTVVRLRALKEVAPLYFTRLNTEKTLDYHRFHLGEDRYLTHLLMEEASNKRKRRVGTLWDNSRSYTIGFCPAARCKTEAPDTWKKLLKQRRRWFLGAIANEIFMLSSPNLWRQTPILMLTKFYDFGCRSLIMYVALFNIFLTTAVFPYLNSDPPPPTTTTDSEIDFMSFMFPISTYALDGPAAIAAWVVPIMFFIGPLVFKWALYIFVGVRLRRWRMSVLYIPVTFSLPFFGMAYMLYALRTYAVRSWGGPRTDRDSDDDPIAVLERVWNSLKMPDEAAIDPEMLQDEAIDIDLNLDNDESARREDDLEKGMNSATTPTTPSTPYRMTNDSDETLKAKADRRYSLRLINFKPLDEDDRNTTYAPTLRRRMSNATHLSSDQHLKLIRPHMITDMFGVSNGLRSRGPSFSQPRSRGPSISQGKLRTIPSTISQKIRFSMPCDEFSQANSTTSTLNEIQRPAPAILVDNTDNTQEGHSYKEEGILVNSQFSTSCPPAFSLVPPSDKKRRISFNVQPNASVPAPVNQHLQANHLRSNSATTSSSQPPDDVVQPDPDPPQENVVPKDL